MLENRSLGCACRAEELNADTDGGAWTETGLNWEAAVNKLEGFKLKRGQDFRLLAVEEDGIKLDWAPFDDDDDEDDEDDDDDWVEGRTLGVITNGPITGTGLMLLDSCAAYRKILNRLK